MRPNRQPTRSPVRCDPVNRSGLSIETRHVEGTVIVDVAGEVDLDTAPRLREAIAVALDEVEGGVCVLDLVDVDYLDSAGLTALVDASREADSRQEPLRIVVDANRPVIRPIEITGLNELLRLYSTIEEALDTGDRAGNDAPG